MHGTVSWMIRGRRCPSYAVYAIRLSRPTSKHGHHVSHLVQVPHLTHAVRLPHAVVTQEATHHFRAHAHILAHQATYIPHQMWVMMVVWMLVGVVEVEVVVRGGRGKRWQRGGRHDVWLLG